MRSKNRNAAQAGKAATKSSATGEQQKRIVESLRERGQTSYDLRRRGVYQVAARIKELRNMGYHITTDPVVIVDADGFRHARVAFYTLVSEPVKRVNLER